MEVPVYKIMRAVEQVKSHSAPPPGGGRRVLRREENDLKGTRGCNVFIDKTHTIMTF